MAPIPPADLQARVAASLLATKYGTAVDRESAHEIISGKLTEARAEAARQAGLLHLNRPHSVRRTRRWEW